jgi:hypothetical protein
MNHKTKTDAATKAVTIQEFDARYNVQPTRQATVQYNPCEDLGRKIAELESKLDEIYQEAKLARGNKTETAFVWMLLDEELRR